MRPTVYAETISLIVEEYAVDAARRAREAAWWRGEGLTFDELLERVGHASIFGKRHGHQRRLSKAALAAGAAALRHVAQKIEAAADFHSLWQLIDDAFRPIRGLGELAVYDAAERLRHRLGLEAPHLIYLHAGARVGARRLAGGRLAREDALGVLRHQLPEGLRGLSTHDIEDVLCIYKDELLLTPAQFLARRGRGSGVRCGVAPEVRPTC